MSDHLKIFNGVLIKVRFYVPNVPRLLIIPNFFLSLLPARAPQKKVIYTLFMSENAIYRISFRVSLGVDEKKVLSNLGQFQVLMKDALLDQCVKYIYQLEKGEQGTYHFQGYGKLKVKQRISTLTHQLVNKLKGLSFNVSPSHDDDALKEYAMKDDTRIQGPWADHVIYRGQDLMHVTQFYPWQRSVYVSLKELPDNRSINWIYDPNGNNGKTMFGKYLMYHMKYPMYQFADAKDLMHLISNNLHKNAYLFDLTRTKPASFSGKDIYSCMEQIKNGVIQNVKYMTSQELMMPPHVWVFANQLPKFESLTGDRWKVWTIENKELIKYIPPPKPAVLPVPSSGSAFVPVVPAPLVFESDADAQAYFDDDFIMST